MKLKKQERVTVLRKLAESIDCPGQQADGESAASRARERKEKGWGDSLNPFKCLSFDIPLMVQLGLQNRTI